MKSQKKDRLREMQLAFIGKLMSGLSHDFKNHLAIIKELNGLIEDLLLLDETGQPANIERYKKIIDGINERIAQAAEMCRVLSGFSHRMDQPLSSLSVTDVLHEKIYLLRRFAQQKQVEVISSFAEGLPVIYNNPSLLQFTIFCILWPVLELMEPDGRILITVGQKDESIEIVIQREGTLKRLEENTPWEDMLPEVVHMLGADFSRGVDQNGNENIVLIISSIEMTHREAAE
jgi:C4-dicarboxylate-specific signal transduction histidine kinase